MNGVAYVETHIKNTILLNGVAYLLWGYSFVTGSVKQGVEVERSIVKVCADGARL
jgi:hypothetical protein